MLVVLLVENRAVLCHVKQRHLITDSLILGVAGEHLLGEGTHLLVRLWGKQKHKSMVTNC